MKVKSAHRLSKDAVSRFAWVEGLAVLGALLSSLFGLVAPFLTKAKTTNLLGSDVTLRLVIVLASILLFGLIIAGVAGLMRHKNRDVILFKRHLANIYLSALRKSALNPAIETMAPHE
jgi:hypothetical protein